jgi:protein SCO1/2
MKSLWAVLIAFLPFLAMLAFPYIASLLGVGGSDGVHDVWGRHLGAPQRIVPVCYKLGSEPTAADFTLVDQFNQTVTLSELWGSPVVITFSYTYCPDVCPLIHVVLNAAIPKLSGYAVLDVSLDPERDTPQRLYAYSVGNRYNWTFLTGPPDVLERVWRSYGVTRVVQSGYIAHDVLFVVVRDGRVLGVVRGLPRPDELAMYINNFVERKC